MLYLIGIQHLDPYIIVNTFFIIDSLWCDSPFYKIRSVSYTHLDVYKRQGLCSISFQWRVSSRRPTLLQDTHKLQQLFIEDVTLFTEDVTLFTEDVTLFTSILLLSAHFVIKRIYQQFLNEKILLKGMGNTNLQINTTTFGCMHTLNYKLKNGCSLECKFC